MKPNLKDFLINEFENRNFKKEKSYKMGIALERVEKALKNKYPFIENDLDNICDLYTNLFVNYLMSLLVSFLNF